MNLRNRPGLDVECSSSTVNAESYSRMGKGFRALRPRQEAAAPATTRTAAVVLGMHRSGTSSVSGTLVKLGAQAPKTLMAGNPSNLLGHFESDALTYLNEKILASAGSAWDDWRAFNQDWRTTPVANEFEQQAVATLAEEFGSAGLIAVKDPRMCRMMPFWIGVFDRTGYAVRVILPVRSPLEVATSLRLRDNFPISKGLLLWLRHVLDAEHASRESPRAILHWSDFLADWRFSLARVAEQTGLVWPRLSDRAAAEIDQFLLPSLRHNLSPAETLAVHPDVNDWVRETYEAVVALAEDPASNSCRQRLDDVRVEFEKASRSFGRVLIDFEDNVVQARRDADVARAERAALAEELVAVRAERDRLAGEATGYLAGLNAAREAQSAAESERDQARSEQNDAERRAVDQLREFNAALVANVEAERRARRCEQERDAIRDAAESRFSADVEEKRRLLRELDRTARRPWRPIKHYFFYFVLTTAAALMAPLSQRHSQRFARSAEKRSPWRFKARNAKACANSNAVSSAPVLEPED